MEKNNEGALALHKSAQRGRAAACQVLLEAAPAAALVADAEGRMPLQLALRTGKQAPHLDAARCLLAAGPATTVLALLSAAGPPALALFADFVIARPPLSGEEWALVPAPCPGLGRALPAALPHSPEQARQLVLHLPPPDVQRLRTSALALHRAHKRWRCSLPMAVVWRILALGNDPEPHPDDPGAQSPPTNLSSFLLSLFCSLVHPVAVLYRHLTG
jgi:ankyrin repeat protein